MPTVDSTFLRKQQQELVAGKPRRSSKHYDSCITTQDSKLIAWEELQEWQMNNEYILTGYRRALYSWRECINSVFSYFHNETVNIHSHLWGAVLFFYILFDFSSALMSDKASSLTWGDAVFMSTFLLSAICCFSCSTIYHTFNCHSEEVLSRCGNLDYTGIVIFIVGTVYTWLYYGFFCNPYILSFYLTLVTIFGFCAAYIILSPEYSTAESRGARAAIFSALGFCAMLPLTHLLAMFDPQILFTDLGFKWVLISSLTYLFGALIYATRFPERLFPGKFDYFLGSHQILHFCVLFASLASYQSAQIAMAYRHSAEGQCGL